MPSQLIVSCTPLSAAGNHIRHYHIKMASKRPGTVDYSKWDHFEDSDDSEEEEQEQDHYSDNADRFNQYSHDNNEEEEDGSYDFEEEDESYYDSQESHQDSSEDEDSYSSSNDEVESFSSGEEERWQRNQRLLARRTRATTLPSLAALQRAWSTDLSNIHRPCSNCFAPDAKYRCSRCQLVRYCNVTCQSAYHPIHKLECIDAAQHQKYWGMFGGKKGEKEEEGGGAVVVDDFVVLKARRSSKRREYILMLCCVYHVK